VRIHNQCPIARSKRTSLSPLTHLGQPDRMLTGQEQRLAGIKADFEPAIC
jgi:hypothetical protein